MVRRLVDEPFVDGEQVVGGVFAHELGHASRFDGRGRHLFGEVGHAHVYGAGTRPLHADFANAHNRCDLPDPVAPWNTTFSRWPR